MMYSKVVQEGLAAGFTLDQIKQSAMEEYNSGLSAGFSSIEMREYLSSEYGITAGPQDGEPEDALEFAALMFQDLAEPSQGSETSSNATQVAAVSGIDALFAGYQTSLTGLAVRGQLPNVVLGPEAGVYEKSMSAVGQMVGDLPGLVFGGTIGGVAGAPTGPGAAVLAGAAAMGVTEGIREYLIDSYTNGRATTAKELFDRTTKVLIATGKGTLIGGATMGAGKAASTMAQAAGTTGGRALTTTLGAELGALTTATSAVQGRLPNLEDFAVNAITLGGMKGAGFYSNKLTDIFVRTGKSPNDITRESIIDPTIREDLAAVNLEVPRAYRSKFRRVFAEGSPEQHGGGAVYTSRVAAERAATEGAAVSEYQIPRAAPVIKYNDAMAARVFKKFMETPEGKGALEKLDPDFFQEYPDFFEKYQSATQERLVPTARKMFQDPIPEFVQFLKGTTDKQLIRSMYGRGGGIENIMNVDWAGVRIGDKILPFRETLVMRAKHKPTGDMDFDAAMSQLDAAVSIGETTGLLTFKEKVHQTYSAVNDKFHALNVGAARGKVTAPYFEARMSAGAPGIATHWMEYGTTKYRDGTNTITGKGLKDILQSVPDVPEFSKYLVAKRVRELSEQGTEVDVDINAAYTVTNNPTMQAKYEAAAQDVFKYNESLLQYSKDAGLITERQLTAMLAKNKAYVPLSKLAEAFEPEMRQLIPEGLIEQKTIIDPLETMISSTFVVTRMAAQNAAKASIAKTLGTPLANKSGAIDAFGEASASKKYQVKYFENGRMRKAAVPKEMADAATLLDADTANIYSGVMKFMSSGASVLRAGAVLSPEFMARNPIRDQFSAAINSNNGYVFGVSALKGAGALINAKTGNKVFKNFDDVYRNWLLDGGANATLVSLDRVYSQEVMRQLSKNPVRNLVKDPVKHYNDIMALVNPLNAPRAALRGLQNISEFTELGTRLGEYMNAKRTGLSGREAAFESRESTIDFMRIGAQTKGLNAISAFFNAKIQGPDRLIRGAIANPVEFLSKAVAGVAIPSILMSIVNNDIMYNSPDSDMAKRLREVPAWQKMAFWVVPAGGTILRIPKPPDWAVLMCGPIETFLDYAFAQGERTFLEQLNENGSLGALGELFVPLPMPSLAGPALEATTNYSFFTGNNIVPAFMEKQSAETQYRPGTTETAKVLAKLMAMIDPLVGTPVMDRLGSPLHIDNLIRGWTGTLGTYALELTDWALATTELHKPGFEAPTKNLEDMPIIKAFTVKYPSSGANSIDKFNKEAKQVEKRYASIQALMKEGNASARDRAEAMIIEGGYGQLDGVRKAMGAISRFVRQVHFSDQIDPDSKRQQIEDAYIQMIQLASEGRKIVKIIKEQNNADNQ